MAAQNVQPRRTQRPDPNLYRSELLDIAFRGDGITYEPHEMMRDSKVPDWQQPHQISKHGLVDLNHQTASTYLIISQFEQKVNGLFILALP